MIAAIMEACAQKKKEEVAPAHHTCRNKQDIPNVVGSRKTIGSKALQKKTTSVSVISSLKLLLPVKYVQYLHVVLHRPRQSVAIE